MLRVRIGEGTQRHQGGDNRDPRKLGKLHQLARGIRFDDAAANVENRRLSLRYQLCSLRDLTRVRRSGGLITWQVNLRRIYVLERGVLHVLRDID